MLIPFFFIVSLFCAAWTTWAIPARNVWTAFIFLGLTAAYTAACIIFALLLLLVSSLCLPNKEKPPKKSKAACWIIREACIAIRQLARVKVEATGLEKIPEGPFLLLSNHRSMLDPIIAISVFWRHPMAFLTKAENMKIPVAGPYIRLGDFLTIDRSDPRSAIKTIRDAAELIRRDDISYGVYPEGTRNKTNEPLLPFHDGIPMIAQKAGVPIVVLCTKNTADITKRFPFRRTRVPFDVLHVYSAEEVASRRSTDLSEEIRNMILEHLEK